MPSPGEGRDTMRARQRLLSRGHNPPQFVDAEIPTFDVVLFGDGGPSKTAPRTQGTNPWIAGSLTLGSNKVWLVDLVHLEASSPNVWFKLRHGHSGTNGIPGGTLESWHMPSRGNRDLVGGKDAPLFSVRGPGTLFLYGFGAGSVSGTSSNRVHRALGTRAVDRFAAKVKGYVI